MNRSFLRWKVHRRTLGFWWVIFYLKRMFAVLARTKKWLYWQAWKVTHVIYHEIEVRTYELSLPEIYQLATMIIRCWHENVKWCSITINLLIIQISIQNSQHIRSKTSPATLNFDRMTDLPANKCVMWCCSSCSAWMKDRVVKFWCGVFTPFLEKEAFPMKNGALSICGIEYKFCKQYFQGFFFFFLLGNTLIRRDNVARVLCYFNHRLT